MLPKKNFSYLMMKFIRPIWYFHLKPYDQKNRVWIDYYDLDELHTKDIVIDDKYSNDDLKLWDASYQALINGLIINNKKYIYMDTFIFTSEDLYRFFRKYYSGIWLYLLFCQRLCFLYNPIKEILALLKTRNVKKHNLSQTYCKYLDYESYQSTILDSSPLVSIIIPTYNRYDALRNILSDLEKQIYRNFEVFIIDQNQNYSSQVYKNININHKVIRQKKPALWKARNRGIELSNSEYLLFLDDDSRIRSNWIVEHIKCINYFNADISSGVSKSLVGDKVPENYSFFRWSDQLDTGNVLIKKEVFKVCGSFDEKFEKMRMGDGEFGVRAYLNGYLNISNPNAYREHLKISKGGLRAMGHSDGFHVNNFFSIRPVPSVFYYWRKYWGNKTALLSCFITLPFSLLPYKFKGKNIGNIISLTLFILLFPYFTLMVLLSWIKSTKLLSYDKI